MLMDDFRRIITAFAGATHVNENVIRVRMGARGNYFVDEILPDLIRVHLLEEVRYVGKGVQRRFKLGLQMQKVQEALEASKGSYEEFLRRIAQ